jgi:hypothetical protein
MDHVDPELTARARARGSPSLRLRFLGARLRSRFDLVCIMMLQVRDICIYCSHQCYRIQHSKYLQARQLGD